MKSHCILLSALLCQGACDAEEVSSSETRYGAEIDASEDGLLGEIVLVASGSTSDSGEPGSISAETDIEAFSIAEEVLDHLVESYPDAVVDAGGISTTLELGLLEPNKLNEGVSYRLTEEGEILQERGVCARVPWGPGKVKWSSNNPGDGGQNFSIAPENTNWLVWASGASQSVDAIYRKSWGCGWAYKIPDSCTATVSSGGGISTCCNAAAAALGHVPKMVNTYNSSYWPNCPLS